MSAVEIVRVYLSEHEGTLDAVLRCLHDEAPVRGVTVFRGIAGFGASRRFHEARWTDLSLDLPVVVEFFDEPATAARARTALAARVPGSPVVYWPAHVGNEVTGSSGTTDEND